MGFTRFARVSSFFLLISTGFLMGFNGFKEFVRVLKSF